MSDYGLTSINAKELLKTHGLNELPEKPLPNNFELVLNQIKSPLVYILVAACVATVVMGDYTDSIVIGVAIFINTVLGFFQEKRAGQALRALKQLIHPMANVVRDGNETSINVEELVPGDVVLLSAGDKIPADGKLISANRLFLTEAMLTGESAPVSKGVDDQVFMGTVVSAGQGRFLVEKTGASTEIGKIAKSIDEIQETTPLKRQLQAFSKQLSLVVLGLTVSIFVLGLILGKSPDEILSTSIALAVSAIPEGLLVGLTVILAIGMQRILANKGLVRHLVSAETLGGVTTICVDKTGTLTEGKMKVVEVLGDFEKLKLQTVVANDRDDPIVLAAYDWGTKDGANYQTNHARLDSLPFSSENKYFVSLNNFSSENNILFVNGAPEVLIELSILEEEEKNKIYGQIDDLTGKGMRVLGFARKMMPRDIDEIKHTDIIRNLDWVGLIAFADPVRKDVKNALEETKRAGIRLVVITGDYSKTAVSVLNQIGVVPRDIDIIDGDSLESMPDSDLEEFLFADRDVKLFSRTRPAQKMKIVQALKSKGEVVAMMGDGVNDAPALTAADIGIVVGDASDVAKESADLVLLDSSFKTIVLAVEEGRGIFDNLRKVILYLLCDAYVGIFIVFTSLVAGLPLPITAAQILWINLISDGFPNLALTIDPKEKDIMLRHPRSHREPLVAGWMKKLILLVSLVGALFGFGMFLYAYVKTGNLMFSRSVAFATIGINTLIYVFSIKTLQEPFWKSNIFNNRWLIIAVFGGLLLQLAPFVVPQLMTLFHTVNIGQYWYGVIGLSLLMFVVIEVLKHMLTSTLALNYGKSEKV